MIFDCLLNFNFFYSWDKRTSATSFLNLGPPICYETNILLFLSIFTSKYLKRWNSQPNSFSISFLIYAGFISLGANSVVLLLTLAVTNVVLVEDRNYPEFVLICDEKRVKLSIFLKLLQLFFRCFGVFYAEFTASLISKSLFSVNWICVQTLLS